MVEISITCKVAVETIPSDVWSDYGGDLALSIASYVLRDLPEGMSYQERTAALTRIVPSSAPPRVGRAPHEEQT